jgi:hypothetical protein
MSIPDSTNAGPYPALCFSIYINDQNQTALPDNRWYLELLTNVPQSIYQGYNSLQIDTSNIKPGYWLSTQTNGQAWKVISISYQDTSICRCIVEDVEWYNASNLSSTEGGPQIGEQGYVFTLGEDGLPVLYPIDPSIIPNASFVTDLIGHFRSRNYYSSYVRVFQSNSNFEIGNVISLTSTGSYQLSTSSTNDVYNSIGIVTSVGIPYASGIMSTGYFTYRPFGQFLTSDRIFPPLTGTNSGVGKIYYLTSTGSLTTTQPLSNSYPVYLQISTGGDGILLKGQYGLSASAGGSTGSMGYQGYQGIIGLQGTQGFIGLQGSQGLMGYQGLAGPTGSDGVQGTIGFQGWQGFQGYQGHTGMQGLQGVEGGIGLQGWQGLQGLQGKDGTSYTGSLGMQGFQGVEGLQGFQGLQGYQGLAGIDGTQGFQGLAGSTGIDGTQGFQGLAGSTGIDGTQGFQGLIGPTGSGLDFAPMFVVDKTTGLITISSSTGGDAEFIFDTNTSQFQLGSGSSITTISPADTVFIDANLNVYNSLVVDAGSGITSFMAYTGGEMIPAVEIDPYAKEIIMMSGSSITSYNPDDTVYIDANLNVYNSLTVEATTGITSFVCYTGGDLVPAFEIDPCEKQLVMMSGSSITSYNPDDTVYIDANLNVYNSLTVEATTGITSFVCYTGGDLVPAFEIDPCEKQLVMMSGSSITSYNPDDTVYIDANLNVYNSLTVEATTGITSFVCYTGGDLVPAFEIDPCDKQLVMMSGSSITSYNPDDTVYIDANLNVYNSLTVEATTGITSFVCYTGGDLVPAFEIDPCDKQLIMMSGTSITSYNPNDTVFIDSNLNVYNSLTVEATTGITSFVCYTGGDLVPAFEIDPCDKQLVMMSGSSITSYNQNDTVFIDSNLNVYNSLIVEATTGKTSFVCYTGGDLVPAFTFDPCESRLIMMSGSSITSINPSDTLYIDTNLNVSNIFTVDQVSGFISVNFYTGGNMISKSILDVYGNITSTGTSNLSTVGTNNLTINNYFKNIISPYTGSSITINANRGKFGYSGWSSTGSTTLLVNNNRVTVDSSVFCTISNNYTSSVFPVVLACIPSNGSFRILFSNNVSLSGNQFDIDFFIVN